jgi:CO/xanthine dehydrogenase Mo-binding subunit
MRGFGALQSAFAAEAQMDQLAGKLALDPIEFRLRNALRPGDALPTGQRIDASVPVEEVIRRCAAIPVPEPERFPRDPIRLPGGTGNTTRGEGVRRGVGFAVAIKSFGFAEGFDDSTAARVRLSRRDDGQLAAEVVCAAAECGQGVTNVILQVARTELQLEDVTLVPYSSAAVGSAGSSSASRMTVMAAGAVQLACRAALEQHRATGADVDVEQVYRHPETTPLHPEDGQVTGERAHPGFAVAAMRVVVEVDVDLGLTRAVWIGTAQDVGRALNPQAVEGQIEGGSAQGLGLALMEGLQVRDGVIANASFTDYLIPTALDMPPVVSELVEHADPDTPYGVKGAGEHPTVVSLPAVAAAMRDATSRALMRVPIRPEDIVGLRVPADRS